MLSGSLKGKYALRTIGIPSSVIPAGELGHTSSNDSPKEGLFPQVHGLDLQIKHEGRTLASGKAQNICAALNSSNIAFAM